MVELQCRRQESCSHAVWCYIHRYTHSRTAKIIYQNERLDSTYDLKHNFPLRYQRASVALCSALVYKPHGFNSHCRHLFGRTVYSILDTHTPTPPTPHPTPCNTRLNTMSPRNHQVLPPADDLHGGNGKHIPGTDAPSIVQPINSQPTTTNL